MQEQFPLSDALHLYSRWWSDQAQDEISHIRFGAGGLVETEPFADGNPPPTEERPFGVNLIGHAFEVFGVGEDVRMAAIAMQSASIPFCVVNVPAQNGTSQSDRSLEPFTLPAGKQGPYQFNLVCMTAIDHARWIARFGLGPQINRTTIVAWPWETQTWPEGWQCVLRLADAFWPSSSFTAKALQPFSDLAGKPLKVMPMTVDITQPERYRDQGHREDNCLKWGLNSRAFLVIFVFDVRSTLARKNPWGAIDAFQQAFAGKTESQAQLVIKTLRPSSDSSAWKKLDSYARNDNRIKIIAEDLCRDELLGIIGSCDVFLSLHRSEGFGRSIAEAGILGLNIVTSDFGGNVDFCKGSRFHMIPCRPWPIPSGLYPAAEGHIWGDPDISTASRVLRHLFHRAEGKRQRDKCTVYLANLSPQKCGERYAKQLTALGHLSGRNTEKRLEAGTISLGEPSQ